MEPGVPVSSSIEEKYCDWPGAANQTKSLVLPGTITVTGLEEMESPVPFKPSSLMGAGLHSGGAQNAVTVATPGNAGVMEPLPVVVMSMGLVDSYSSERPVMSWPLVSVTMVVRFCATPCVTTPVELPLAGALQLVLPLASAIQMDLGGQVEK